jgi:hypothetical protein
MTSLHEPTKAALRSESEGSDPSLSDKEKLDGSLPDVHNGPPQLQETPIIRTGKDISEFVVDVRDDGDTPLTFRSFILGTLFAGLAASLAQVCCAQFKLHSYEYFLASTLI